MKRLQARFAQLEAAKKNALKDRDYAEQTLEDNKVRLQAAESARSRVEDTLRGEKENSLRTLELLEGLLDDQADLVERMEELTQKLRPQSIPSLSGRHIVIRNLDYWLKKRDVKVFIACPVFFRCAL